jgi:hypothetical protein
MAGAVRFAAENEDDDAQRYWAAATRGDLEVLIGQSEGVTRAYQEAVSVPGVDWFSLHSSRDQLLLMRDLGFRPDAVNAGLAVFERKIAQLQRPLEADGRLVLAVQQLIRKAAMKVGLSECGMLHGKCVQPIRRILEPIGADIRNRPGKFPRCIGRVAPEPNAPQCVLGVLNNLRISVMKNLRDCTAMPG